ncbi:MAG: asparaginase domain-containing protein, partial [Candidatus Thermoplasmatota archaeon]|nr:asparaginase domain-containing protein [Candidatus Thermoplasmatota archaeon]
RSIARLRVRMLGNMWSDDVRPRHWNGMIEATSEAFEQGYAGVVITHGTDTLHLSAAALAYAWSGCGGRPPGRIVLTGSQRSPDRGSSDAYENLIAAVHWAASGPDPTGHRDASVVVMHDTGSDGRCVVLPGCSSRKAHSTRRGAFVVVNQGPIGHISLKSGHPVIEASEPRGAQREVES